MNIWLNGALVPEDEARVSAADHGLLVADGVFETLRCYAGVPFALTGHAERLIAGARALGIKPPEPAVLEHAVRAVVESNGLEEARLRITLTSGPGPAGLERGETPTLLVSGGPLRPWPPTASAIISRFRRDNSSPLAGVKTVALVEHVLALAEARDGGADEALLTNVMGEICEATTANVFALVDGLVQTPPVKSGCLPGITREWVLRICVEQRIGAIEMPMRPLALRAADELFLTSTTREVQPLVQLDGQPVGDGQPGPVTQHLAAAFKEMVAREIAG